MRVKYSSWYEPGKYDMVDYEAIYVFLNYLDNKDKTGIQKCNDHEEYHRITLVIRIYHTNHCAYKKGVTAHVTDVQPAYPVYVFNTSN